MIFFHLITKLLVYIILIGSIFQEWLITLGVYLKRTHVFKLKKCMTDIEVKMD